MSRHMIEEKCRIAFISQKCQSKDNQKFRHPPPEESTVRLQLTLETSLFTD